MAAHSVNWMLAVFVGFGLVTPLEAMSHHGGHSNWTLTTPENCPYNDTTTHVCSRLYSFTAPCISITCCESMEEHEESADAEDFMDSNGVVQDNRNGAQCSAVCFVLSLCSYYECFSECCEGYMRDRMGRCQNQTNEVECKNGGTKRMTYDGFYYCGCAPGFKGRLCEQPVCECRNNGTCHIEDGQPVCRCPIGYHGKHCELHECGITCYNGGTCVSNGDREACNCSAPYVGKYCETKHLQSSECPAPKPHYLAEDRCYAECETDRHCYGDQHCCQDGCSRQCKRPRSATCEKDGQVFAAGQVYRIGECKTCTCTESGRFYCNGTEVCPQLRCGPGYEPVKKPGHCCLVCSDTGSSSSSPPHINCPRYPVQIEVPADSSKVLLTARNTKVTAWNGKTELPRVWFEPRYLEHCKLSYPNYQRTKTVSAYAGDSDGGEAKCQLEAEVVDRHPPVVKNCPQKVFAFEGDRVLWDDPVAIDNVGIAQMSATRGIRNQRLRANPEGKEYMVEYRFTDYDQNTAFCRFNVSIHKKDTPLHQLPQDLRMRTVEEKEEFNVGLIVGPIIGAVGIFALIVAIALWMRMRRHGNRPCRSDRPLPPQPAPSVGRFDNNIYHLPTDAKLMTPPPYSLPSNPPPYTQVGGDMKEGEYAYIAPPQYTESDQKSQTSAYTNPDYESIKREA